MRNEPQRLSPADIFKQTNNLDVLKGASKASVTYVKRDGKTSSSTGTIAYFNGRPGFDTGSVTIQTEDKGPRTINLHRIVDIKTFE